MRRWSRAISWNRREATCSSIENGTARSSPAHRRGGGPHLQWRGVSARATAPPPRQAARSPSPKPGRIEGDSCRPRHLRTRRFAMSGLLTLERTPSVPEQYTAGTPWNTPCSGPKAVGNSKHRQPAKLKSSNNSHLRNRLDKTNLSGYIISRSVDITPLHRHCRTGAGEIRWPEFRAIRRRLRPARAMCRTRSSGGRTAACRTAHKI